MIATIIVTWNQPDRVLVCLDHLAATQAIPTDIWLVDNGSQPPIGPQLQARYPALRVIRLERNFGFAIGQNAGIRAALAAGAACVFLLNDDAYVEPTTLPTLYEALQADPQIAAVGPLVYDLGQHGSARMIQSAGIRVDANSGRIWMQGSGEVDHGQYGAADQHALSGCAMLIRRRAWEQVGELWEPFFNYAEEIDWCLRARRLGWRLRLVPQAHLWHHTSSSLGAEAPLKVYLLTRNQWYLRQRNHQPGLAAWRGAAVALFWNGRTLLRYLRLGQPRLAYAMLLGWWDYLRQRSGNCRTL
ncbi:MAG: glycosyltransferase family 2 protein [Roseiflexaceae bacterium]